MPDTVRIILTAYTETKLLLEAIRRGHVQDYIVKPWKKSELKPVLEKYLAEYEARKKKMLELGSRLARTESLEEDLLRFFDNREIVGAEGGLKQPLEIVNKVAPTDATILVLGETGTGKELLARMLHAKSKRTQGPFIAVHCAALSQNLLESELFGHEKGAFTGADQVRIGRFESANHGTIFLDEIGEIPEDTQVKLLRVLQEKEIQRVGGNRSIPIDARLIAATNRNLHQEVQQGKFREDLYYRLNVIPIKVPPLRERKSDIPALAKAFLEKHSKKTNARVTLSQEALNYLASYDWPGNVRELQNIIERAVILNPDSILEPADLNLNFEEMLKTDQVDLQKLKSALPLRASLKDQQTAKLTAALTEAEGNIAEAARLLNLPRSTLFSRLKKFGLI
jgi:two-component system response regulator HydG